VSTIQRHNVDEQIFGSAGVLDANDTFEFEERSDFLLSDLNMYPSFRQYYIFFTLCPEYRFFDVKFLMLTAKSVVACVI
jgi:hypothetical protein